MDGDGVGADEGSADGFAVGIADGVFVGNSVGTAVGTAVGTEVGTVVGSSVGWAVPKWLEMMVMFENVAFPRLYCDVPNLVDIHQTGAIARI